MGCGCCDDPEELDESEMPLVTRSATNSCSSAPPIVNPTIQRNSPVVLLPKPYQVNPHRIRIDLGVDRAFDGTAQLAFTNAGKIDVYGTAVGGVALGKPLNITNLEINVGHVVYIQAVQVSDAMDDIRLTLSLVGGTNAGPAQYVDITCGELKLEIFKPRPQGGAPVAIVENQKNDPGGYVHLQREDYCQRVKMIVHKAKPYDYAGNIVLSTSNDKIKVFDQEDPTGGIEQNLDLIIDNGGIHQVNGQEYWVEGANSSGALHDTNFQLKVENLNQDGDQVQFTVVKAELKICKSRVGVNDPLPMSDVDKINVGRFIHKQNADNDHGLAKLIVPQVEPAAFRGHLEFTVWDLTADSNASPRVILFQNEAGDVGQRANPYDYDFTGAAFPIAGLVHWVKGTTVSGDIRDTEIRLGVKDSNDVYVTRICDKVKTTVVEFTEVKATIKPTPANTPGRSPVPANHVFNTDADVTKKYKEDFAVNEPLVLMRNAQPDIALEVTVAPDRDNLPIKWQAIRNPNDDISLGDGNAIPTVTPDGHDSWKAELNADNKGSFYIRAFIDCNNSDKFEDKEPSIPLTLVLADVDVAGAVDNSSTQNGQLSCVPGNWGGVHIKGGNWSNNNPLSNADIKQAAMAMEVVAIVTAGGVDGKLGIDKVFGGLINNVRNVRYRATYRDLAGPTDYFVDQVYVTDKSLATGFLTGTQAGYEMFLPTDPPLNIIAFPILDAGRHGAGTGGETATMSRSHASSRINNPHGIGQQWTMRCMDAPSRCFFWNHPTHVNAKLIKIEYRHEFTQFFCFWTNISKSRGATGDSADRVYSVIVSGDWGIEGDWDVTPPAGMAAAVLTNTHAHSVNYAGVKIDPIGRAQDNGLEVRPPSGIAGSLVFRTT